MINFVNLQNPLEYDVTAQGLAKTLLLDRLLTQGKIYRLDQDAPDTDFANMFWLKIMVNLSSFLFAFVARPVHLHLSHRDGYVRTVNRPC